MYPQSMIRSVFNGAGWLAAVVFLLASGCSRIDNPLAPRSHDPAYTQTPDAASTGLATKRVRAEESVSRMVSAEHGGVLRLEGRSRHNGPYLYILRIPPGALSADTRITMSLPSKEAACLDFSPEGLTFNNPVRLTMVIDERLRQTQIEGEADIYWYNPETDAWEAQGGQVVRLNRRIIQGVAALDHFSRYSLGGDCPILKAY